MQSARRAKSASLWGLVGLVGLGAGPLGAGCATPTTTIAIPPCADRVEVVGQASRQSPHRFELDHSLDLPWTKSVVTFQQAPGGQEGQAERRSVELVSTQPEPVRLFVGAVAGVGAGLLFASAAYELSAGATLAQERPFYQTLGGVGLGAVAAAALFTGWHPVQKYVDFPGACPAEEERGVAERDGIEER
jgi:hypothetical protein